MTLRLRTDGLNWQEIDGEIIALDEHGMRYVAANGAAAVLWQQLVGGTTREDLAARLLETYGIAGDRALADADAFIAQLNSEGLLAR